MNRAIIGALSTSVAIALLAGCGGAQGPLNQLAGSSANGVRRDFDYCTGQHSGMIAQTVTVHKESKRNTFPKGLTPANIQAAYDLPSLSRGASQIVAIVLQCDNPDVANDQAVFRSQFGLPAGHFYKFNEYGQQSNYPPTVKPWGIYDDVSVEMVAAVCPDCTIYLIEANNFDVPDLETATATALSLGAHIISEPWGCAYAGCLEPSYFDKKGVTYVGLGAIPGETFPADLDSVVAAGGTYLSQGGGGKRGWTETVWAGFGGGCFTDVPKPKWQQKFSCSGRASNDVSMVANFVDAYDSFDGLGNDQGWINDSGNGLPTNLIAGVFALAGNAKDQDGGRTFWLKKHLKHLYKIECGGSCIYGSRFSYADGWGSPHGVAAF